MGLYTAAATGGVYDDAAGALTTTELSFLLNTSSYVQLTKLHHIPAYNERIRQPLALAETSFPACSDHHVTASGGEEEERVLRGPCWCLLMLLG